MLDEKITLLAGAAGLGVVSTFFLPNTLEDLLAVAVGGAVGYAALLNLPLKRGDAKEKLTRVATNFAEVTPENLVALTYFSVPVGITCKIQMARIMLWHTIPQQKMHQRMKLHRSRRSRVEVKYEHL